MQQYTCGATVSSGLLFSSWAKIIRTVLHYIYISHASPGLIAVTGKSCLTTRKDHIVCQATEHMYVYEHVNCTVLLVY